MGLSGQVTTLFRHSRHIEENNVFSLFTGHGKEASNIASDVGLLSASNDNGLLTSDGEISDAWKLFIAENQWKPPANFMWPTSSHKNVTQ